MIVFVAAIWDVAANPTANSTTAHNQNALACENTISPIAHVVHVAPIHFANPLYSVRAANCSAPSTAPTPAALISNPNALAPPCKISCA